MSKSATSENNYISLTDDPAQAAKKVMRAETDSGSEIKFDEKNKPGISNLLTIYSLFSNIPVKQLEENYQGKGYGDFKKDLAEAVKDFLIGFQEKFDSISDEGVNKIMRDGADKIRPIAQETIDKVKRTLGI